MTTIAENTTELACSLNNAEFRERRAAMRKRLIPHIIRVEDNELSVLLGFRDQEIMRSEVATFVELEQQCCGFLSFTISPPGEQLTVLINGPEGSQSALKVFADTARGRVSVVSSVETKLKKGGLTGIALGAFALLACELPIVLGVIGLGSLSSAASTLSPPFWAEVAALIASIIGTVVLIVVFIRKLWRRQKPAVE